MYASRASYLSFLPRGETLSVTFDHFDSSPCLGNEVSLTGLAAHVHPCLTGFCGTCSPPYGACFPPHWFVQSSCCDAVASDVTWYCASTVRLLNP